MNNAIQQFRAALAGRGIVPPDEIEADGELHRADVEGKPNGKDAAYLLHLDGVPAGGFENHRDGIGWENWRADIGRKLNPAEEAVHGERIAAQAARRKAETEKRHAEAQERACLIWANADRAMTHPYLMAKGIKAHGARLIFADAARRDAHNLSPELTGLLLVIPMMADGKLQCLQFITADGVKRPLTGGKKRGCYFGIGKPDGTLCIAEGFATAASIHEATGYAVAVAFDAGNLLPVAQALRAKFPDIRLVLCADDDWQTEGNPGLSKAREAAAAVGGAVAVPDFTGLQRGEKDTDFNDLARLKREAGHE
jgi:putative DNA primase/helicase